MGRSVGGRGGCWVVVGGWAGGGWWVVYPPTHTLQRSPTQPCCWLLSVGCWLLVLLLLLPLLLLLLLLPLLLAAGCWLLAAAGCWQWRCWPAGALGNDAAPLLLAGNGDAGRLP